MAFFLHHIAEVAYALLVLAWFAIPLFASARGALVPPLLPLALLGEGGSETFGFPLVTCVAYPIPVLCLFKIAAAFLEPKAPSIADPTRIVAIVLNILISALVLAIPLEAFHFSRESFEVRIGDNRFSLAGIEAGLTYSGVTPLPFSVLRPGIMGPFTYAPFMECYHGIGSLDHGLSGSMSVGGRRVDFSGGRGYIEKDWGRSFPRAWIWAQSNTFGEPGTPFLFSLARMSSPRGLPAASLTSRCRTAASASSFTSNALMKGFSWPP